MADFPGQRSLVAIDLENAASSPRVCLEWAKKIGPFLKDLLQLKVEDLVYVAGSPGNGLSGSLYQQVGEPEKKTRVVTMECVRGCSDRGPAVMQYIPVQC